MMVPFDGAGPPQQGQQAVAPQPMPRPPMPPGHVQAPSPVMHHGHHQPMNQPHYGHHSSGSMSGHGNYQMPPSPARQGSFTGSLPGNNPYSSHAPLHQPHNPQPGGAPRHPSMPSNHRTHRGNTMNRPHPNMANAPPAMAPRDTSRHVSSGGQPRPYGNEQRAGPNMGSSSGSWQSEKDTPYRREMIQNIVKLLKKDKHGTPESSHKLPQMAKQLEVCLYRNARSFDAYVDVSTLKQRLQQIAAEVSRPSGDASREKKHPSNFMDRSQPPQPPPPSYSNTNGVRNDPSSSTSPFMGSSSTSGSMNGSMGGNMGGMDMNNSMSMSNVNHGHMGSNGRVSSSSMAPNMSSGMSSGMSSSGMGPSGMGGSGMSSSGMGGSNSQNPNDPEWKVRIRHKQQRLLLLHHSAKCSHEDGRCTVTPHCADMKRLWRHMEACKDNECRVSHCFSSRAILSHYRKCKDQSCPACGPVRDTVRKNRSSRTTSASTGPIMDMMRGSASVAPSMPNNLPPAANGMGNSSVASFDPNPSVGSNAYQNRQPTQRPTPSHSTQPNRGMMPPPSSSGVPGPVGMHHSSSQYGSNSNNGAPSAASFGDTQNGDNRASSSVSRHTESSTSPVPPTASLSSGGGLGGGSRNDSEWTKIKHKQQRLLLLRHASRCQHPAGKCPVTPHCASMKKLWEHIAHCKNQQCTIQHCLSSRYVLSHYRRCKDARCPACGPVRETIKNSAERDRGRSQGSRRNAFDTASSSDLMDPSPMDSTVHQQAQPQLSVPLAPVSQQSQMPSEPPYQPPPKRPKHDQPPSMPNPAVSAPDMPQPVESAPPQSAPIAVTSEPEVQKPPTQTIRPTPTHGKGKGKKVEPPSKPNSDHSLLASLTVAQLETHLASLDRKALLSPAILKSKCTEVLKGLQTHQHGWVFNAPVDPVELGLPDYFEIIKKPMDLGTIQRRLDSGNYHSLDHFESDVHLTFDNAMTYNELGSVVYDMAKELKTKFLSDMKKLMDHLEAEDRKLRQNERACTLCGCEKLLFEPPVYFCNGMNCQNQRIRRNSHFYIGGNNQYFWCTSCYTELDDKIPIELVDMKIMKADLKKKKNDEVHEESWVECDTCERWVHQVCGLFNSRQNKEHHSEYNAHDACTRSARAVQQSLHLPNLHKQLICLGPCSPNG